MRRLGTGQWAAFGMLTCLVVSAQPQSTRSPKNYQEADAVLRAVIKHVDETGSWARKTQAQRIATIRDIEVLNKRSEQVFGDNVWGAYGPCVSTTLKLRSYVQDLNTYARALDGMTQLDSVQMLTPMQMAFGFGDHYRVCRELVEKLYVAPIKR